MSTEITQMENVSIRTISQDEWTAFLEKHGQENKFTFIEGAHHVAATTLGGNVLKGLMTFDIAEFGMYYVPRVTVLTLEEFGIDEGQIARILVSVIPLVVPKLEQLGCKIWYTAHGNRVDVCASNKAYHAGFGVAAVTYSQYVHPKCPVGFKLHILGGTPAEIGCLISASQWREFRDNFLEANPRTTVCSSHPCELGGNDPDRRFLHLALINQRDQSIVSYGRFIVSEGDDGYNAALAFYHHHTEMRRDEYAKFMMAALRFYFDSEYGSRIVVRPQGSIVEPAWHLLVSGELVA